MCEKLQLERRTVIYQMALCAPFLFFYLVLGSLTLLNIKIRAAWECVCVFVCVRCVSVTFLMGCL